MQIARGSDIVVVVLTAVQWASHSWSNKFERERRLLFTKIAQMTACHSLSP